jgi:hypothetical protein
MKTATVPLGDARVSWPGEAPSPWRQHVTPPPPDTVPPPPPPEMPADPGDLPQEVPQPEPAPPAG